MSAPAPSIQAILICDIVLKEAGTNKQSAIGIFTGDCSNAQGCTYSGTPSTYNVTGNTLTNNRYEGLFAGSGTTNASGNTITGSNIGVEARSALAWTLGTRADRDRG